MGFTDVLNMDIRTVIIYATSHQVFSFLSFEEEKQDRLLNKLFERKLSTWRKVERPKWVEATTSPTAEHRAGPALQSVFMALFNILRHGLTKLKKHEFSSHSKKGNWVFVGRNAPNPAREGWEGGLKSCSPFLCSSSLSLCCPSLLWFGILQWTRGRDNDADYAVSISFISHILFFKIAQ